MRKIVLYGVIAFQILLIISLIRGIQLSLRAKGRITDLQTKKEQLIQEEERVKQQEEYVQSQYYLEKVAREELHWSRPGETVVIVPEAIRGEESPQARPKTEEVANWQKWWRVLTGKNN